MQRLVVDNDVEFAKFGPFCWIRIALPNAYHLQGHTNIKTSYSQTLLSAPLLFVKPKVTNSSLIKSQLVSHSRNFPFIKDSVLGNVVTKCSWNINLLSCHALAMNRCGDKSEQPATFLFV